MRTRTKVPSELDGIKQLKKGLYLVRATRVDPKTGRRRDVKRKVRCMSLQAAARARDELQEEIARAAPKPGRVRLADYATSWLTGKLPMLKPSTQARYGRDLDRLVADLGDIYLDALSPEDVQGWIGEKSEIWAPATVNGCLRVLKTMMADADAHRDLPKNPVARIRALPERPDTESDEPRNLLSADEMARFLETLQERFPQWHTLVFTQFATARRFGEVAALRWEDIDEERGVVKIRRAHWNGHVSTTKTGNRVTAPLTDELKDLLHEWRQQMVRTKHRHLDSGWIFPSRAGKPHLNASCMRKAFVDCLEQIGVKRDFSSHGLRRTANDLLRRVASGQVTRAITGHVTEAMTEHYSHVDAAEKRKAAEGMLTLLRGGSRT